MTKQTSIYLDIIRIIAALGVVLVHANLPVFSDHLFLQGHYGHKLVMIFFVLSGFLVAFTTDIKRKDLPTYIIDRSSRLYSVVVPALIFTYTIDGIGQHFNPSFYAPYIPADGQWWRALLNLTFLQQNWTLCTKPSSNGTFWSIAYEFWYYMLFGVAVYIKPYGKKITILVLVALFVGVKIILLLPVWALGAYFYHISKRWKLSFYKGLILFVINTSLCIYLTIDDSIGFLENVFVFGQPPLFFSSKFLFDYLYGVLIAINILIVTIIDFKTWIIDERNFIVIFIRKLSSMTFTLYLFHLPFLLIIGALAPYPKGNLAVCIFILLLIVGLCYIISTLIEPTRKYYKQLGEKILTITNSKHGH